jgi:hypothetical protein
MDPPPTADRFATMDAFMTRSDELGAVVAQLAAADAQSFARTNRRALLAVVEHVRDRDGLGALWRSAWPSPLLVHRDPARCDWTRTIVHPSWTVPDTAEWATDFIEEAVRFDMCPPASSADDGGVVLAWRFSVEWCARWSRDDAFEPVASFTTVVDARGPSLGLSHTSRIPKAHRVAACSSASHFRRVATDAPRLLEAADVARGYIHDMGWDEPFDARADVMAETRSDGAIFLKLAPHTPSGRAPSVRIVPSLDLRAAFWLHARTLEPLRRPDRPDRPDRVATAPFGPLGPLSG